MNKNYICGSYLPAGGLTEEQLCRIDFGKITHLFFAFSTLEANENGFNVPALSESVKDGIRLTQGHIAETGASTKLLISIGGAGADGFCKAASTEESRKAFALQCAEILCEYKLDGLDMDWEFPGLPHGGIEACESCVNDYILLLSEIRKAIGDKLLTAAVACDHRDRFDNAALNELLDFVNVMTYDMNNTSHSSMELTKRAMEGWASHGISREKLILGVPFYARSENTEYEWAGYDSLMRLVNDGKAELLKDDNQDYIIIGESKLSIDTPQSIKRKAAYIKQNGFGGIFNWHELCDFNGELREAMVSGVN